MPNHTRPDTPRFAPLRRAARVALLLCLAIAGCGGSGSAMAPPPPPPPTTVAFNDAQALWLTQAVIAWPGASNGHTFRLYTSAAANLAVKSDGTVTGADASFDLGAPSGLGSLAASYPQLSGNIALGVPATATTQLRTLLKTQLVVVELSAAQVLRATQLQLQGVLDDSYAAAAAGQALGLSFAADATPTFRLWAPTAVKVQIGVGGVLHDMALDAASGVWRYTGSAASTNASYYSYAVQVYARTDGNAIRTYTVTDPYAVTLNADASGGPPQQAMVADLGSAALKPAGWDAAPLALQLDPEDIVLYELHLRDFSINDPSVTLANRGKYLAFTEGASAGMTHLKRLAAAGLSHVHLLPVFDIASVDEGSCTTPAIPAVTNPADKGPEIIQSTTRDTDCFNWGYDPKHYGAPEGSYSSNAGDGAVRVREFRSMVQSLHQAGLSLVMDVVYNHMASNYLDQVVPGYYYRLDNAGNITHTSCCTDAAPEFLMVERLMTDTLRTWVTQYRVDGFRFDIMAAIPKAVMLRAKTAVDAAAGPARKIYFYGEGWTGAQNFVASTQANMAGTGLGTFNDRIRDAIRGGGPFDGGAALVGNQGFIDGECWDPNAQPAGSATCADLQLRQGWIRRSLAGGLQGYVLAGVSGAADTSYFGQSVGYAGQPRDLINYASSHDGETLYDISQYKHPAATSAADRARSQVVALGTLLVGQGIPFIHAGDELLRSKAFDRNSYNSGDWFNRIDWSGTSNYINLMGLPQATDNSANWAVMTPILMSANIVPTATTIAATRDAVLDLLRVRRSTSMFRLHTPAEVAACVQFPDAISQVNGLIVMQIGGAGAACGDGAYRSIVVLINAGKAAQTYAIPALTGHALVLHPAQAAGADAIAKSSSYAAATGAFSVPARTIAVFVEP